MDKIISWVVVARATVILFLSLIYVSANANGIIQLPGCAFKHSVETTARKSTVWRLWSDVENWKKFDTLLEYSYLADGSEFVEGAIGYIKADGAFKTKFELTKVQAPDSFIESLKLPLYTTIELKRYFEKNGNGKTTFTHEVDFKGPLKWLVYALSAGTFKKELPLVMGRLKDVAEREEQYASESFDDK